MNEVNNIKRVRYSDKLRSSYYEEIKSWNWDSLSFQPVFDHFNFPSSSQEEDGGEDKPSYESCWIGTVFGLTPSGKVYTFWTTNQTSRDVIRDTAWWEAFEQVLDEKGYWHEGDSGDVFVCRHVEVEEAA